jgi:hypothetical protein
MLATWESSWRFDILAGLTDAELMGVAQKLASKSEETDEVTAMAGEQRDIVHQDDPIRKVALVSIFICLLVLAGKMKADDGWALMNLLAALIPLFTLYARRD